MLFYAVWCIVGAIVGSGVLFFILQSLGRSALQVATKEGDKLKADAIAAGEAKAREFELTARQEIIKNKEAFEKEVEADRRDMREAEQRLAKREDTLDHKLDTLTVKEHNLESMEGRLAARDKALAAKEKQLDEAVEEQRQKLLQISGMTPEQAREILLQRVESECRHDAGALVQKITEQAQEEAKEKARMITLQAIQRYASEQTCDHTVSTVEIPSDDMKGRVIGREGRNIRAFEKSTGVDVIIDDTPGLVIVSCFDPVRREIARRSLE
ncbi:MAG: Rnase Y domain-containing protein, partial [Tepidisphaeraceae bacterium]